MLLKTQQLLFAINFHILMIQYSTHILSNGLKVIFHLDMTVQTVALNILYNIGARNEHSEMTGMAHLFEHLMFSGSLHADDYDEVLQNAGGENNAYTTNDFTNYYITLPYQNLETAIWLEADRMQHLNLNSHSLDVQKKVVIEEFKEHYINKPYGDAWKHLREMTYTTHPYRWMTIGKDISHIENVTLQDAESFYNKYYSPDNATVCLAGHFDPEVALSLCRKYFEGIPPHGITPDVIPDEPQQTSQRTKTIFRNVPLHAVWIAYPIAPRTDHKYYIADIISDILGSGKTALLYQEFVKTKQSFTEISCYHTGSVNNGLFVIEGKISDGYDYDKAIEELLDFIEVFRNKKIDPLELTKIKNKIESLLVFEDIQLLNRANNLAYYTWLGNTDIINSELDRYLNIQVSDIEAYLPEFLHPSQSNILNYRKQDTAHTGLTPEQ